MARPDLKPGFGGWQVVDATPQESSEGLSLVTFIIKMTKEMSFSLIAQ